MSTLAERLRQIIANRTERERFWQHAHEIARYSLQMDAIIVERYKRGALPGQLGLFDKPPEKSASPTAQAPPVAPPKPVGRQTAMPGMLFEPAPPKPATPPAGPGNTGPGHWTPEDEQKHRRAPKGPHGGEFAPKPKEPEPVAPPTPKAEKKPKESVPKPPEPKAEEPKPKAPEQKPKELTHEELLAKNKRGEKLTPAEAMRLLEEFQKKKPTPTPPKPVEKAKEPEHEKPKDEPAAERPGSGEPGPGGTGNRGDGRTDSEIRSSKIEIVRPELTKPANPDLVPESIRRFLDPHQVQGAAVAISAMDRVGGALIADSPGVGKTREILAIAKVYADQGKKVLIVAPAEVIKPDWKVGTMEGSYFKDGQAMGVGTFLNQGDHPLVPGSIHATTYENLAKFRPNVDQNTVILWDESHKVNNPDSIRGGEASAMSRMAGKVCYATATPADKPFHIGHLARAGVFDERPPDETYKELGMVRSKSAKDEGPDVWKIDPQVGKAEAMRRLDGLFRQMTAEGLMIKREIRMDGLEVSVEPVELPDECFSIMKDIAEAYEGLPRQRGTMLLHQRRQQETYKIPLAIELAKKELAEGRQVVIFASRVNDSEVKLKGSEFVIARSPGTMPALLKALADAGIHNVSQIHGGVTKKKQKEDMAKFQDGVNQVVIATTESGGTGINLDDITGDNPRTTLVMTAPFSGIMNIQMAGRTHRLTTKSNSRIKYLTGNTAIDEWNARLIAGKMKLAGAVISGGVKNLDVTDPDLAEELKHDLTEEGAQEAAGEGQGNSTERKSKAFSNQPYQWWPLTKEHPDYKEHLAKRAKGQEEEAENKRKKKETDLEERRKRAREKREQEDREHEARMEEWRKKAAEDDAKFQAELEKVRAERDAKKKAAEAAAGGTSTSGGGTSTTGGGTPEAKASDKQLARKLSEIMNPGMTFEPREMPHWLEKAKKLASAPRTVEGVRDALVNFDWMKGMVMSPSDRRRYEKVLDLLGGPEAGPSEPKKPPTPPPPKKPVHATFTKLRTTGAWGVRTEGDAEPGDMVTVTKKDGKTTQAKLLNRIWKGDDGTGLWEISQYMQEPDGRVVRYAIEAPKTRADAELAARVRYTMRTRQPVGSLKDEIMRALGS